MSSKKFLKIIIKYCKLTIYNINTQISSIKISNIHIGKGDSDQKVYPL